MIRRKKYDLILNLITSIFSSFEIIILLLLLYFIFSNGYKTLNFKLLFGDYQEQVYSSHLVENIKFYDYKDPNIINAYFSKKWGIALRDIKNQENEAAVEIVYLDTYSPVRNMNSSKTMGYINIIEGQYVDKVILKDNYGNYKIGIARNGAKSIIDCFEHGDIITDLITSTEGGGIRGSLLSTLYLIILTLLVSLPLGIMAAIYLTEYANDNKITSIMKTMIEMTSGIPSIIFGLVGAIIFIPFMNKLINSNGGSLASGALTLSIILLPVIIKTTEEAIKIVPKGYREASLALGASRSQTTFKLVIPSAIKGILTATILSVSRIVGESAALIYAVGTTINDKVSINNKSTSLAVHIWSLMSGENPNFAVASAISIVILLVVLVLNMVVKIIGKKITKEEV